MSVKILLLEDDSSLGTTLKERLQLEGYETDWATSKSEASKLFAANGSDDYYDLLLLDVGLPDGSGLDFARDVRIKSAVPIVFLSAMNTASNRLEGFEIGAEDYIPKPFHLKELLLRIKRIFPEVKLEGIRNYQGCAIDFDSRSIINSDGKRLFPATKDFDVLSYLISASPRVLSRQEILKAVWKDNSDNQSGRSVDNTIVRLRQHLNNDNFDYIRSVRGIGYQWLIQSNSKL